MRTSRLIPLLLGACLLPACSSAGSDVEDSEDSISKKVDPQLLAAAKANLVRISAEIDKSHLKNYGISGEVPDQFITALSQEFSKTPSLLTSRLKAIASMVFFSAPEVTTDPTIGHVTPFHGLSEAQMESLSDSEDFIFSSHTSANGGSPNGVRPFSVCETTYLINIAKGKVTDPTFVSNGMVTNFDKYALAYQKFAASKTNCSTKDLNEWYNFRGLGGLRPTWLESNISERVVRRMVSACRRTTLSDELKAECAAFQKGRLAYRDAKNTEFALREMVYDPQGKIGAMTAEQYMINPSNAGVFVDDRDGDGVGEWIVPGPAKLLPGAPFTASSTAQVSFRQQNEFSSSIQITDGGVAKAIDVGFVDAVQAVDARWKKEFLKKPDLGLTTIFNSSVGCEGDAIDLSKCELLKRFASLIDRHESFYQTYSSLDPTSNGLSSQPSPLVACSITLNAARQWDSAGTPTGGTAGFVFLMRIPFEQILVGDKRSIDTLGRLKGNLTSGPAVLTVHDILAGTKKLDMSKVWLDIATLSHNQFESEHEISKYGSVPADQIEGILVMRRPANMK